MNLHTYIHIYIYTYIYIYNIIGIFVCLLYEIKEKFWRMRLIGYLAVGLVQKIVKALFLLYIEEYIPTRPLSCMTLEKVHYKHF